MKFTPEQLTTFASAGWSPEAIKEMLEYDTEIQKKLEEAAPVTPEDGVNHIEDPAPQPEQAKTETAGDILEKMLNN